MIRASQMGKRFMLETVQWEELRKIRSYKLHSAPYPFNSMYVLIMWVESRSRYIDWLRAGRSGDQIPEGTRFSTPFQTGPGAHPASCTMGTGSFPGVKSGWGVTLTPHPLLVQWSRKSRAMPLSTLWAVRPVQRLSACTRGALYLYIAICQHNGDVSPVN